MIQLDEICHQVCQLAKTTGNFIQEEREKFGNSHVKAEAKGDADFVTEIDKASERKLVKGLSDILPQSTFLTEEGTIIAQESDWQWIIDPIDGTTNFIYGIPCYSISIGLYHNSNIVLGVIYEITRQECFYAWEGSKAYLNGQAIQVSSTLKLQDSLLVMGFPYQDGGRLDEYLILLKELIQGSRGIRRMGSAAVDMAYVACGRFDAFYEYGLHSWDVAAGSIIVKQAGGTVSDFDNGSDYLFGNEIIVSNGKVHAELKQYINRYFPG